MKLAIVSHTPHYRDDGRTVGWGPTVREIDYLSEMFESVVHVAPMYPGPSPATSLPYTSERVRLLPVNAAGGRGLVAKLGIIAQLPAWNRAIGAAVGECDAVHVRCPAGIALVALVRLILQRAPRKRWVKYAGAWGGRPGEPWSYRLQRWVLRRNLHRGVVSVNGRWPRQAPHVVSFVNPCLTAEELDRGRQAAAAKEMTAQVFMLFVGRLNEAKGSTRAVEALAKLSARGIDAFLDVVGDGPERARLEHATRSFGTIEFHGWKPRSEVNKLYDRAHILIHPSASEGWPKVISEAMAHGAVPVAGSASAIASELHDLGVGKAVAPHDVVGLVDAIEDYVNDAASWKAESLRAARVAEAYTYSAYLGNVRTLFEDAWGAPLSVADLRSQRS